MLLQPHAITCVKRDGHFCHPLHVAMQSGLYLLWLAPETGVESLRIPNRCRFGLSCGLSASRALLPADCESAGSREFSDFPAFGQFLLRLMF